MVKNVTLWLQNRRRIHRAIVVIEKMDGVYEIKKGAQYLLLTKGEQMCIIYVLIDRHLKISGQAVQCVKQLQTILISLPVNRIIIPSHACGF